MKYHSLDHTDFHVSEIGLGTMSFSTDEKANQQILDLAISKGINFLDTADLYQKGAVEEMLGKLTKRTRNELILASKVGNVWNADGSTWRWNPSPKQIRLGLDQSLKRLNTDYIDLYQLHGGTKEDAWDDIIETFQNLKTEGKIRGFGVSSIRPNVVRKLSTYEGISTVMCQLSILDRRSEEFIIPKLQKSRIKMLARGVFAKGLLLNKPAKKYLNYSKFEIEGFKKYLSGFGFRNETLAMSFALRHPSVASLLIGTSRLSQMKSTLAGYEELSKIPDELLNEIANKVPVNFYDSHR